MERPTRSPARVLWLLLAAFDACLLVYLVLSYRWFAHEVPDASNSPGAIIIYPIAYAILALVTILEIGFVVVIGVGIARQFRPSWLSSRWFGLVVPIPLMGLLIAVTVWAFHLRPIAAIRDTARVDRFEVFLRLAQDAGTTWHPPVLVEGEAVSYGLVLALLLGIAYLAEKYGLAWLHVRWPVPLTPIALVVWLGWIVTTGEQVQREFVNRREWRAVAEAHTYPQALEACEALGPGWTLPRPSELQLYLGTRPEAILGWQGIAWTNTTAERGHTRVVVVELAPRRSGVWERPRSGVWQRQEVVNRSVSTCEIDSRERPVVDAFTRQRARLCASTPDAARLHATTLEIVALRRGLGVQLGQAGTVCVKREAQQADPGVGARTYAKQQEFSTSAEYLASVRAACDTQPLRKDIICVTLAAEPLPFEENDTERIYRLSCDHEGRIAACEGYATLMDRRGEAERAGVYRDRARALGERK
jgi:hypothetical protein